MKIRFVKSLAVVIAMIAGSSAFGQDYYAECSDIETVSFMGGDSCQKDDGCGKGGKGCDDGCGKGGCGVLDGLGCGVGGGGAYVDAEALFFRANPGNGAPSPEFDHEIAPRIAVGYVGPAGLGIRFRYFDYSHNAGVDLNALGVGDRNLLVDTYNMDVEFFEKIDVGCLTSIEWSAGVRYNDFKYRDIEVFDVDFVDAYREQFSGWGLTFGLQVDRCLGPGNIYARARWAILRDDNSTSENDFGDPNAIAFGNPDVAIDDVRMQTEIALGYEVSRCTNFGVVTARIGYEIQFWDSYTEFFPNNQIGSPATESNFGFDGLVLGLELAR